MNVLEYWKKRCKLAEMYIEESPCDPDITMSRLVAYSAWVHFKELDVPQPLKLDCNHDWKNGIDNSFKRCKKCLVVEYLP